MASGDDAGFLQDPRAERAWLLRAWLRVLLLATGHCFGLVIPFLCLLGGVLWTATVDASSIVSCGFILVTMALYARWAFGSPSPLAAGLASGALAVSALVCSWMASAFLWLAWISSDASILVSLPAAVFAGTAASYAFASWDLLARSRRSGWKLALNAFIAGACVYFSIWFTAGRLLPPAS